jgi:hypothetical protein
MSRWSLVLIACVSLGGASVGVAADDALERLLRAQVFNKEFEGFDQYQVRIESDERQSDGSREVLAVASGKFLENRKRIKALFLIVGEHIIGGQVVESEDLPPCQASASPPASSL